jgi:hypothetical protein
VAISTASRIFPLLLLLNSGWLGSLFTGREASGSGRWLPKPPPSGSSATTVVATIPRGGILAPQGIAIVVGVWAGWRIFDWGNG